MSEQGAQDADQLARDMRANGILLSEEAQRVGFVGMDGRPPSLRVLDELVDNLVDPDADPDGDTEGLIMAAGSYLGDVAVLAGGGRWTPCPEGSAVPAVRSRTGYVWYPLTHVIDRAQSREAPSMVQVWLHAMAGAPVPAPDKPAGESRFAGDLQQVMWAWGAYGAALVQLNGRPVTWDDAGVAALEELCGWMQAQGVDHDEADEQSTPLGAYLGELLRARVGGEWESAPESAMPGLRVHRGVVCFPIDKVYKRLTDGAEHDLTGFVDFVVLGARGGIPGT